MAKEDRKAGLKHECELPPEENEFAHAPNFHYGVFVGLKRFLMASIIIWRDNSMSLRTYKSDYVIRRENTVQLQRENCVIHPFSILRYSWEVTMLVVFIVMFMLPLGNFFHIRGLFIVHMILAIFNAIDIMLTFNTGFLIENIGQVVMNRRIIVRAYLFGWFIPDLISLVSFFFFAEDVMSDSMRQLEILQFLAILRLPACSKYIKQVEASIDAYRFRRQKHQLYFKLFVIFIWTINLYHIERPAVESPLSPGQKTTLFLVHRFFSNIYLIGNSTRYLDINFMYLDMITYLVGVILQILILSFIYRIYGKYAHRGERHINLMQQMQKFGECRRLPMSIRCKITEYMTYLEKRHKIVEKEFLEIMPKSLQREVLCYIYANLLEESSLFHGVPMEIIYKLATRLTHGIFMPTDIIISLGTPADTLYFIKSGRVAVYSPAGKELAHLNDGSTFGELVLVESERRNASVVAIDWCELAMLGRLDLLDVLQSYPELLKTIKAGIRKRSFVGTSELDSWKDDDASSTESVKTESTFSSIVAI